MIGVVFYMYIEHVSERTQVFSMDYFHSELVHIG